METATNTHRAQVAAALRRRRITPTPGGQVYAYVNHGRWLADCPCGGAELAAPGEQMMCGSCGLLHNVVFPEELSKIEGLLEKRPVRNQNWLIGETAERLAVENERHGIK